MDSELLHFLGTGPVAWRFFCCSDPRPGPPQRNLLGEFGWGLHFAKQDCTNLDTQCLGNGGRTFPEAPFWRFLARIGRADRWQ